MDKHEDRAFGLLRLVVGASAFALAYQHTLEWLARHGIDGWAGVVTAGCIDVMALICLRGIAKTRGWLRASHAAGFVWSLTISLIAQIQEGSNGHGAGPFLSTGPVLVFAYLTVIREASRTRVQAPAPSTRASSRPARRVSRPAAELDAAEPQAGRPAIAEVSSREPEQAGGAASRAMLAAISYMTEHGDELPSTRVLAAECGASRGTCAKVLSQLRGEQPTELHAVSDEVAS